MTQQNPRELLKHGDPNAIASSINRTLKPKGINADVTRDNGCLHINLESDKVPDQMVLVDFIRTGMTKLGLESIHTVKVYGRRTGDGEPAWEDEIDLMPEDPMPYGVESGMPDDSVGLDDVEPEGEDYYQDGEFDRDEEDEDEDEDEDEEEAPPPKKQFPKWVIPVGLLVPVAALAGLFFTKTFPFGDSNPEPNPPEAASPSPKPSSPASKATAPSPPHLRVSHRQNLLHQKRLPLRRLPQAQLRHLHHPKLHQPLGRLRQPLLHQKPPPLSLTLGGKPLTKLRGQQFWPRRLSLKMSGSQ
jgi:hypothetical protein